LPKTTKQALLLVGVAATNKHLVELLLLTWHHALVLLKALKVEVLSLLDLRQLRGRVDHFIALVLELIELLVLTLEVKVIVLELESSHAAMTAKTSGRSRLIMALLELLRLVHILANVHQVLQPLLLIVHRRQVLHLLELLWKRSLEALLLLELLLLEELLYELIVLFTVALIVIHRELSLIVEVLIVHHL